MKLKYLLASALLFTAFSTTINAATIKETTINNDGYDTIKNGDIVIGITRFDGTNVVTGSKVAKASTNDSKYYLKENKSLDNYQAPTIYVYMGLGGWYSLDDDNNAQAVTNSELLNKLENSNIYYVNNVEKKLEIDVNDYSINKDSLPSGVKLENNKLIVNATISEFKVESTDGIEMVFKKNNDHYVLDQSKYYTLDEKGFITNYTGPKGDIEILSEINDVKIVGIKSGAFKDIEITSVVIPESVMTIESNSFDDAKLTKVIVNEKYDSSDFTGLASDAFGSFSNITYNNDITRLLNSYNNELTLNIQKNYKYLDASEDYIIANLARILENKRINYVEDYSGNVYVSFEYKNENTLTITVSKRITQSSTKTVSKDVTYTLNKVDGNKTDLENISKAKKEYDNYYNNVKNNFKNNTSLKLATRDKLYEIYGLYDISCEINGLGDGEYFNEGINVVDGEFQYFIIANNILYDVSIINTQEHAHFGVTTLENTYESDDEYVSSLLKYFEKETKVTSYKIQKLGEKDYEVSTSDGVKTYRLIVTDSKNSNTWEIVSKLQIK